MGPSESTSAAPLPASIEVTPKQASTAEALSGLLPAGTRVYLTDLGTDSVAVLAEAAVRIRDLGLEPVPHIAVRRIRSRAEIESRLKGFRDAAGVTDVLIIGGGAEPPSGPFDSTMALLETGLIDAAGMTRIGIAGHPEGSPDISDEIIEQALRQKIAFANRTGAEMRIVTQFGFDPAVVIRWMEGLMAGGMDLPVHLGVAGPAKVMTLLKYAAMCGVGPSLEFLRKRSGILSALATSYSPESLVEPLERWHRATPASPLAAIHVFPFGGIGQAASWLGERGSFQQIRATGTSSNGSS